MKTNIDQSCIPALHAKKSIIAALLLAGVAQTYVVQAAVLNTGDTLTINPGIYEPSYYSVVAGSYYAIDANGNGTFSSDERGPISQGTQGLVIGVTQPAASFGHPGSPSGTEGGTIDAAWSFLGNTGMHFTASPVTGSTTAGLDFSGWRWTWNGIPSISWGGGFQDCGTASDGICVYGASDIAGTFDNGSGIASFSWDGIYGHGYTLDYTAVAAQADPSGFGGVPYQLHLEGTVNAVPVPAAVWLFGSGLAGLVAMARRRKA